jgi:tetratricopeptide (TPR) repeat protein/predicted Ser/Thr protein kinase
MEFPPEDRRGRGVDDATRRIVDPNEETATVAPGETLELEAGVGVGRYVVIAPIGAGGMGVVYSAYDPELDRKVALKLLRTDPFGYELQRDGRTRLLREAQALAKLAHPNVVAIFDVGAFRDRVFLAMELIEGQHLGQWLASATRSWPAIVEIFLDAGAGLAAAHRAGLLHRDFKLENVVLGTDGRARVLDFGLARLTRDIAATGSGQAAVVHAGAGEQAASWSTPLSAELTVAGELVGTPAYLAPELVGDGHPDARSDQYAFCVALYRALYGRAPHQADNLLDLIRQIGEGEMRPIAPRGLAGTVPLFLRQILRRGLARDPADRFATLDELLAALRAGRRRRRWILRGLFAASVATVLAAGLWSRESKLERHCRSAGDAAVQAWTPELRAATGQAFAATGLPFAAESWATVGPQADAWAGAWREQSELSCRATFVDQTQTEKLFELRRACLDLRLRQFQALVALWGHADAKAVGAARSAIAEIRGLEACADGRTLLAMAEPPAAQAAEVAALRGELAAISSLELATDYQLARERLAPVLARSAALGFAPLEAEAQALAGELADDLGDYAEAHRAYFRAYVAAQRGRQGEIAFRASHGMGWVDAMRLQKIEAGDEWLALATAELDALGEVPSLRRRLLDLRATLLYLRRDYAAAEALHREALALVDQEPDGATSPARVDILSRIGLTYEDRGRHDLAMEHQLEALEVHREIFGEGHPDSATYVLNLGNAYMGQERYREAIPQYERALSLFALHVGERHASAATALNNLGVAYDRVGDGERALRYHERARATQLAIFGPDHVEVLRSNRNLAEVYIRRGNLDRARELIGQSLGSVERIGEAGLAEHAYALAALAEIEIHAGRGPAAVTAIDAAFAILGRQIEPLEEAPGRAIRARALWLAGRRADARADARRALALYRELGRSEADDVAAWLAAHP